MGQYEVFTFEGVNIGDGDQALWVKVDERTPVQGLDVDCNAAERTNTRQVIDNQATFTFESWGRYVSQ